jgi:battenin
MVMVVRLFHKMEESPLSSSFKDAQQQQQQQESSLRSSRENGDEEHKNDPESKHSVSPPIRSRSRSHSHSHSDNHTRSRSPNGRYQPVAMELEDGDPYCRAPNGLHSSSSTSTSTSNATSTSTRRVVACFWILGLLNNTSYVIMIACAKSISEGGTALVFLANIVPSLVVKGSAPYWFDAVSYRMRLRVAALCMATSFVLVALATTAASSTLTTTTRTTTPDSSSVLDFTLTIQLLGVAFGSFQAGLGEASLLALAGSVDGTTSTSTSTSSSNNNNNKGQCLTSFSSGTGMAGVFGFFWKWLWNDTLGFSMSTTLWLALSLAVGYLWVFQYAQICLQQHVEEQEQEDLATTPTMERLPQEEQEEERLVPHETQALAPLSAPPTSHSIPATSNPPISISEMTLTERFQLVLRLWPYMIPLFGVYAAEYALQAGTWTAIGFPVESREARDHFFEYSNWMYQAGVFLSRSSGTLFTAPMSLLWLMPALQFVNLGLYTYIAATATATATATTTTTSSSSMLMDSLLYRPVVLYAGALYTGLLGGAVYVHGYKRICLDIPNIEYREFSLSSTSVAEGIGIVVADLMGLVLQSCLYQVNQLDGALVSCPFSIHDDS